MIRTFVAIPTFIAIRTFIVAASLVFAAANSGFAAQNGNADPNPAPVPQLDGAGNRLMVINGNTGRVVYDDGRDDLFCVTRRHVIGQHDDGRHIYRRSMRCR